MSVLLLIACQMVLGLLPPGMQEGRGAQWIPLP